MLADTPPDGRQVSFSILAMALHTPFPSLRAFPCRTLFDEWMSPDGKVPPHSLPFYPFIEAPNHFRFRDVTDHLQLLLRKGGAHLHTSAEREVVRTIKEKACYVALNPAKEEKDSLIRKEEFKLPDGNVLWVS
jgi:hypothetical protein